MQVYKLFKPTIKWIGSVLLVLLGSIFSLFSQNLPEAPNHLVTDYTGTLSRSETQALERKLLSFEDTTSTQIAVVLIRSTEGYDVADYAVQLGQKWGVGGKKYNNGVILLAALEDRTVTIQTGYGMEGALPDIIAHRIIQNEIRPNFSRQQYYQGLDAATNAIIAYTKGEYKADPKDRREKGEGIPVILIVVIVVVIISLISKGGGGGRGGRVMTGRGASDIFWWTLLSGMGRSGGGGSGGFGGGGGGGFGGFGGGGFGGGGASGRW
ncbi:TPM domain-containing protein [Sphingobacterium phlebotomi]|uniref:TPM domain-containing protein n=1 Tax=Sphingobacterium phlebotomi TaxID=2605433 RepID=A0A5D4HAG5_9SPHI|nr:TPM domain-containing protein [Sphingobacterium phlebotomi]TYR37607.1 TPM domain-containing protein [Sphingobacterium phlebotomi]